MSVLIFLTAGLFLAGLVIMVGLVALVGGICMTSCGVFGSYRGSRAARRYLKPSIR